MKKIIIDPKKFASLKRHVTLKIARINNCLSLISRHKLHAGLCCSLCDDILDWSRSSGEGRKDHLFTAIVNQRVQCSRLFVHRSGECHHMSSSIIQHCSYHPHYCEGTYITCSWSLKKDFNNYFLHNLNNFSYILKWRCKYSIQERVASGPGNR